MELRCGPLRAVLRPDLGGSLAGLWRLGVPVLRSTEGPALAGPRSAANFPLLPYSNRIASRRFEWQGQTFELAPNFDSSPHSLHGVGWLRAWAVVSHADDQARLRLQHAPDADWPFAFEAEQQFSLGPDTLRLELSLRNTDRRSQPVGLGWHPYFPRRPGSRLRVAAATRWERGDDELPSQPTAIAGIAAPVSALQLDHCHAGWQPPAVIEDEHFRIELQASDNLRHLVVFTPAGREFFCVEPVSHLNDAIHRPDPRAHGLLALAPGDTASAWMTLRISPSSP